jgi:hypothetical protein
VYIAKESKGEKSNFIEVGGETRHSFIGSSYLATWLDHAHYQLPRA